MHESLGYYLTTRRLSKDSVLFHLGFAHSWIPWTAIPDYQTRTQKVLGSQLLACSKILHQSCWCQGFPLAFQVRYISTDTYHFRSEWWLKFQILKLLPVDTLEERMALDLFSTISSQSLINVTIEHWFDDRVSISCQVRWQLELIIQNLLLKSIVVLVTERWLIELVQPHWLYISSEHIKNKNSNTPPIGSFVLQRLRTWPIDNKMRKLITYISNSLNHFRC